jgi:hypothetical protein
MKKLLGIVFLLAMVTLPAIAQWQRWRLSPDDQQRFDSYYSRWQDYRSKNDRDQITSMEKRMLDVYARYNVPPQTPYWRVASNGRSAQAQWRGRLSSGDQARFDSYFSRWQDYRRTNNREQVVSMEKRMQDVYSHYRIPAGTPYFWVASNARDEDWDRWESERWRGRLSPEDQGRFDSYYSRWMDYRRGDRRSDIDSMERRMREVMDRYQIPPRVPYEQIASRGSGY